MTPFHRLGFSGPEGARIAVFAVAILLAACAGGSPGSDKIYVPDDMPDICKDIDFSHDVGLRKTCGVKSHNYLAYRNIPEHRDLMEPKAGVIIQKGVALQLRLENFLPVDLPADFQGKLRFGENVRREIVKSKMDYVEFFPADAERPDRLIRLDIPLDNNETKSVCYTVERKMETQQRLVGTAGKLTPLACEDFNRIKTKTSAANQGAPRKPEVRGRYE